jgi:hypothetical protein
MIVDSSRYPGWTYVCIDKSTAWEVAEFFPLIDRMLKQIRASFESTGRPFVFDISALEKFDSSLVSLVIQTVRLTGDLRNALVLPSGKSREVVETLGLPRLIDVYGSKEEWESTVKPKGR